MTLVLVALAVLVVVTAAVGGFFAAVKGEPPPFEPDDRAGWPDAS